MAKLKKAFFCQNCGMQSPKWVGKCTSCGEWNTYVEEIIQKEAPSNSVSALITSKKTIKPTKITEVVFNEETRYPLTDGELSRVLGGGLVPGSLILFAGEPGIGKSTLLLQLAMQMKGIKIVYISGEESEQQIKMRAERIGSLNQECYLFTETSMQNILLHLAGLEADIVIVDSIQTIHSQLIESSAGSISQIRECTAELMRFAKETATPVFLIGHITKDGSIAGPKVLEHMVDVVLQFEGDRNFMYRLLRAQKNRFGSTNELGIYEMNSMGLMPIHNPSELLIGSRDEPLSGSATAATVEGIRPLLIEVQALVSSAAYGTPQRSSTGFDLRRLNMLLAVLEKRCGFRLGIKDVFLNIAGGIRVDDPAIDLAVISAILSSSEDIHINSKYTFAAEVGLSGEIRPVSKIEQRIMEGQKLGFEKIFLSKYNKKGIEQKNYKIELVFVAKIEQVFELLFA
ncbi:DNA repair protein RadA [Acidiluteibacter ferrifornacis]|uniref:DNA repair protein RadA n=1 Tax=Acidiluteibacter ferrifornacis TaxID=2692424 RepID=A0A6N9NGA8_9FLAO|nr:DNA repair protein RadA [Acidiluteibacter ferrifornacis]MBR9830808.1 DNA repair protein RadA [bacterium]NBG64834.1 DNA repair protein RadA [Acidiluteibacter ferrifornacis]